MQVPVAVWGVGVGVALAAGLLAWLVMDALTPESSPMKRRLNQIRPNDGGGVPSLQVISPLRRAMLAFAASLSQRLYSQNRSYLEHIRRLLAEAGLPDNERAVWQFLSSRVMWAFGTGAVLMLVSLVGRFGFGVILGSLIAGLLAGGILAERRLAWAGHRRREEMRYGLPDTLDLMVVCLEAGLGLDATLQRVAEEIHLLCPPLNSELRRLNRDLSVGVQRADGFRQLAQRTHLDELRSLSSLMIQSDRLGTSIAEALRQFAVDLRTRRRQRAEELAMKASIKMTFPLVLFIFPPMLIVLMGPSVINTIDAFFKK